MSAEIYRTLIPLFEDLQSERLIIRPYRESDARTLFEAVAESREHIRPWLPWADTHQTIEETRDWIIHSTVQWMLRESIGCSIWEKTTGQFLGGIGLHPRDWDFGYFEIGYWLCVSAPGHGYMTEAVKLLAEFAFITLKAKRVEIRCDERNTRSAAVARRLGFVQEACLRNHMRSAVDGQLRNTLIFSRVPGDRGSQKKM